jgi:potassium/hydrogen antiporter
VMWFFNFSWMISLLTGFMLGGVSSAFVIPVLGQLKIQEKMYSLLALESALTDVLCIVASLTIIELINLGNIGLQKIFTQLVSLFAVAGLFGIVGGVIWIFLIMKVFKQHNYMMTIAYLLLLYVLTEFLQGNGAIAAMFFGLMLKNSKPLTSILRGIVTHKAKDKKKAIKGDLGESVTTPSEQFFYHQISFFLKTFFFVYIGLLIDVSDYRALIIGVILSVVIFFSRMSSFALTRKMEPINRGLVNSIFARGLAAAAIAQLAIIKIPPGLIATSILEQVMKIAFITITGTILLSSIRVFLIKRHLPKPTS